MNDAPLPEESVTDLTYLSQFCEADPERMQAYTQMYEVSMAAYMQKLSVAIKVQNLEELSGLLHSVKPKCMMMGMRKTNELRAELETLCNSGQNSPELYAGLAVFEQYLIKSVEELSGSSKR